MEDSMTFFLHPQSAGACCRRLHSLVRVLHLRTISRVRFLSLDWCRVSIAAHLPSSNTWKRTDLHPTNLGDLIDPAKSRELPTTTRSAGPQSTPHYTMPYLKTSTEWYEQSSLLLKARPTSVRLQLPLMRFMRANRVLDTHHIQVHRPETFSLEDQEARKVRDKASSKTRRHITNVITTAAVESGGSYSDLRFEDI